MSASSNQDFVRQLRGWELVTLEITYRMPDYLNLLQTFTWQEYDEVPTLPRMNKFIQHWRKNIEGPLVLVRLAHVGIVGPCDLRHVGSEWVLN